MSNPIKPITQGYEKLFDVRGRAYDNAMRRYPLAREQEFLLAINAARIIPGMIVADVPAGGGYLQQFLAEGCIWKGHEPSGGFNHHSCLDPDKPQTALLPLPWPDASFDAAISLAGVHHIVEKAPLFADIRRVVKPGGRFVLADVAAGSAVARFLDGYVGAHNSTGHEGFFLDDRTSTELQQTGWTLLSSSINDIYWVFDNRDAMAGYCHELFDLKKSSIEQTKHAIEQQLGVEELANGRIGMRWSLMTIVVE